MITTVQCSICSQLNNKHSVVVTDFRLHHTCSIIIRGVGRSCKVIRPTLCVPALGIHVNRTCQETRYCACACNIAFTQKFENCTGKQCDINVALNLYKTSKNISSMLGVGTKVISTLFKV